MLSLFASTVLMQNLDSRSLTIGYPFATQAIVTSGFSMDRLHPILGYRRPHNGVDLGMPTGTPIKAVTSGKVVFSGWYNGGGNTVVIENDYQKSVYMHLSNIGVRKNSEVNRGAYIGNVGSTGWSTGAHLHLEYHLKINKRWVAVDPLKYFDTSDIAKEKP